MGFGVEEAVGSWGTAVEEEEGSIENQGIVG